jgi:hypothetical protein
MNDNEEWTGRSAQGNSYGLKQWVIRIASMLMYWPLANSVGLSATRETTSCAAIRWFPSGMWRFITAFTRDSYLCQTNPVHTTPSYLNKIHFYVIHPPFLVFLVVSFPRAFLPITHTRSSSPHSHHVPCSTHPWLHDSNHTWWRVQVMQLSPLSIT